MWAEPDIIDTCAVILSHLCQPQVDGINRRPLHQPTVDTRLVGHDEDAESALTEQGKRLQRPWKYAELSPHSYVIGPVLIDHPVPIQKDGMHVTLAPRATRKPTAVHKVTTAGDANRTLRHQEWLGVSELRDVARERYKRGVNDA